MRRFSLRLDCTAGLWVRLVVSRSGQQADCPGRAKIAFMPDEMELLKRVYDRFNARDMESVLAAMHEEVMWANGMEGGHVHGVDGVRKYWTH